MTGERMRAGAVQTELANAGESGMCLVFFLDGLRGQVPFRGLPAHWCIDGLACSAGICTPHAWHSCSAIHPVIQSHEHGQAQAAWRC